jgi:hypothetical protein
MPILMRAVAILMATVLLLNTGLSAQTTADRNAQKARAKLQSIFEDGERTKIELKDGRRVQGYITELNADDFVLSNGEVKRLKYADVRKVGRFGPSRSAKRWVAIGVTGGILGLLIGLASQTD